MTPMSAPESISPYRLFIFDFDGTLADSFPAFARHLGATLEHFGLRALTASEIAGLRGRSAGEVIQHLQIPAWKVPLMARDIRKRIVGDLAQITLFPGIREVLQTLRQGGAKLAIVSSNSEANVRAVLGAEMGDWIEVYECGASLFGKASRFRKVLKRTGVAAAETLTIGDEIRDHEAAEKAGIAFGAVGWGYTDGAALAERGPAFVFHCPQDIIDRAVLVAHLLGSLPSVLHDQDEGIAEALRRDQEMDANPEIGITLEQLDERIRDRRK